MLIHFCSLAINAQPDAFQFSPNSASGTFYGQVTINGVSADQNDWIAAFDESGICAGAAQIILNEGIAYANLVIYGDDATSVYVDEGIGNGETFQLMLWRASYNDITPYPNADNPIDFTDWSNTNGAPMPEYSDVNVVYDFTAESTVSIINPGTICSDDNPILLEGYPTGGLFSGTGVNDGFFDPEISGIGDHVIYYEINGIIVTAIISVIDNQDVTIVTSGPFCMNSGVIMLEATIDDGTWIGPAVFDNTIDVSILDPGTYVLEYFIENGNCSSEDQITFSVFPSPESPNLLFDGNQIVAEYDEDLSSAWYNEQGNLLEENTSIYTPLSSGTYFFAVTNSYGCNATSSITVDASNISMYSNDIDWYWINDNDIQFSSLETRHIQLFSISGFLIASYQVVNGSVSLPNLSSGVYILASYSNTHKTSTIFVK